MKPEVLLDQFTSRKVVFNNTIEYSIIPLKIFQTSIFLISLSDYTLLHLHIQDSNELSTRK